MFIGKFLQINSLSIAFRQLSSSLYPRVLLTHLSRNKFLYCTPKSIVTEYTPQLYWHSKMSGAEREKCDRFVWIDLEMTGLDVDKETIMEAAVIVTDSNLGIVAEGPNIVLRVDDKVLNKMGEWCRVHHGESGLTELCRKSTISLESAEDQLLSFLVQYTVPGKSPLAGNSVHADKRFLDKYMPKLMQHLHYRIVDVSTVKELCRRWYPADFEEAPKKKLTHRALEDIRESIEELAYYRNAIFKSDV